MYRGVGEILFVPGNKHISGLRLCSSSRGFQKPGNPSLGPSSVVSPPGGPGPQLFPCLAFTSSHGKEKADCPRAAQCGPNPILMASGLCSGQGTHLCPCQPVCPCPSTWTWAAVGGLLIGHMLEATFWPPHEYLSSCWDPQVQQKGHGLGLV